MLDRISEFIETEQLFPPGSKVVVGYSGGPDSTCLLHALVKLGFRCVATHLHHGQRPEADAELEGCQSFASNLGAEFISGRADIPAMTTEFKIGVEEAGQARYSLFDQAVRQSQGSVIATAHTLDDHLETVLINLARGTGMTGLRGIPVKRNNIVRPLLCMTKDETLAYCATHGLTFLHDPANDDLSFSRARVRHRIVPELKHLNPASSRSVFRMSKLIGEEDDFLNGMAAAALERSEHIGNSDLAFLSKHLEVVLRREQITSLPPVLFKRAIRLASKALGAEFDSKHVLATLSGIASTSKGAVTAPDGQVTVEWSERFITISRRDKVEPFLRNLEIPGVIESDALGWKLSSRIEAGSGETPTRKSLAAKIPSTLLQRPLFFRSIAAGDRMQPLGFSGHRKVSDLVAEAGLSQIARHRLPIICDLLGPIWIPGVCLDQRVANRFGDTDVITIGFAEL